MSPTLHAYVEAKVILFGMVIRTFRSFLYGSNLNMTLMELIGIETSTTPTLKLAVFYKEATD